MFKTFTNKQLHIAICALALCVTCTQSTADETSHKSSIEPEMVTIPGGTFEMGSYERDDEQPIHSVTISAFKLSTTEVTFDLWDACVNAGGCSHIPEDESWGRGNHPVVNVSYEDITGEFIPWLNQASGQIFRLPSETEWEYAASGGSTTKYFWGDEIDCSQAQYGRGEAREGQWPAGECSDRYDGTVSVKSFSPNQYGVYDMHGNAWELVEDCYHDSYKGAPQDGRAWLSGDCALDHVLKGGAWFTTPVYLRSADRNGISATHRDFLIGFRLAQDLPD